MIATCPPSSGLRRRMPTLAAAQPCFARQASVAPQRRPRHAVPDRGAGAPSRAALFLPKRLELAPEPGLGRGVLRRLVAGAVTTSRSGSDGRPPLLALPLCSGAGPSHRIPLPQEKAGGAARDRPGGAGSDRHCARLPSPCTRSSPRREGIRGRGVLVGRLSGQLFTLPG